MTCRASTLSSTGSISMGTFSSSTGLPYEMAAWGEGEDTEILPPALDFPRNDHLGDPPEPEASAYERISSEYARLELSRSIEDPELLPDAREFFEVDQDVLTYCYGLIRSLKLSHVSNGNGFKR